MRHLFLRKASKPCIVALSRIQSILSLIVVSYNNIAILSLKTGDYQVEKLYPKTALLINVSIIILKAVD